MKLVVGLGNPEPKYFKTYHNLGFVAVERAAELFGAQFSKKQFGALIAETRAGTEKILFAKPQTYMNLSGESVRQIVDFYKIPLSDLLIIYDDFDLPKGAIRIRKDGSAGTHNGMRNVTENLGTDGFKRIRIGIGDNTPASLIDYVLSEIKIEDYPVYSEAVNGAAEAARGFCEGADFDAVMRKYNRKP